MLASCSKDKEDNRVHMDVLFKQDLGEKYELHEDNVTLKKVAADRNGVIQIFSSSGLFKPFAGEFLYPGKLVSDKTYRPLAYKKIQALNRYQNHFVYLDDKAIRLFCAQHKLSKILLLPLC